MLDSGTRRLGGAGRGADSSSTCDALQTDPFLLLRVSESSQSRLEEGQVFGTRSDRVAWPF